MGNKTKIFLTYVFGVDGDKKMYAAQKKLDRAIKKTQANLDTMGTRGRIALAALAVGVGKVIGVYGAYEAQLKRTAITMRATKEQTEGLDKAIREVAKNSPKTAKEVAEAANYLAQASFDYDEVRAALKSTIDLSVVAGLDIGTATDLATDALVSFGLEAKDLSRVVDVWVRGSQLANTNVEQLGRAFKKVGGSAKAAGLSIEDTTALLLVMSSVAKGEEAGVAANKLIIDLQRNAAELKEFGIHVYDAENNMRSIGEVLDDYGEAVKAAGNDQEKFNLLMEVGSVRALKGLQAALAQGSANFDDYLKKLKESGGTTADAIEKLAATEQFSRASMMSGIEELSITIGRVLVPHVIALYAWIKNAALVVAEWVDNNKELFVSLLKWTGISLVVISTLGVVFRVARGILVVIRLWPAALWAAKVAWAALTLGVTLFNAALGVLLFLGAPIWAAFALIGVIITAIIAAGILVVANWETIWEKIKAVWDLMKEGWKWVKEKLGWSDADAGADEGVDGEGEGDDTNVDDEGADIDGEGTEPPDDERFEKLLEIQTMVASGDAEGLKELDLNELSPDVRTAVIESGLIIDIQKLTGKQKKDAQKDLNDDLLDMNLKHETNLGKLLKKAGDDELDADKKKKLKQLKVGVQFINAKNRLKLKDAVKTAAQAPPRAYAETVAANSFLPWPAPQILGALAFALSAKQAASSVAAASGIDAFVPAFRKGGFVPFVDTQGISSVSGAGVGDSVNARLEPGELVIDRPNTAEVLAAVRQAAQSEAGGGQPIVLNIDGDPVARVVIDKMAKEGLI